jgi:hypothetical protein
MVDILTLLKAVSNMTLRYACLINEAFFLVKNKISALGSTLLQGQIIRVSKLLIV